MKNRISSKFDFFDALWRFLHDAFETSSRDHIAVEKFWAKMVPWKVCGVLRQVFKEIRARSYDALFFDLRNYLKIGNFEG